MVGQNNSFAKSDYLFTVILLFIAFPLSLQSPVSHLGIFL